MVRLAIVVVSYLTQTGKGRYYSPAEKVQKKLKFGLDNDDNYSIIQE
tara:strand:+ start:85 stop:225 length:141 start_codon:yes stop_codon:yes gene_type:complete